MKIGFNFDSYIITSATMLEKNIFFEKESFDELSN